MQSLQAQAFDSEYFRKQGHLLVDLLANYIRDAQKGPEDMPVFPRKHPDQLYQEWQKDYEEHYQDKDIQKVFEKILRENIHTLHPKYLGHQVASPLPINALADMLGSLMNSGMGVYEMGSPMVALERLVVKETAKVLGFSEAADGILTSGGSLGNLTALLAARSAKAGYDLWQEGQRNKSKLAVMVSAESHYCVNRAIKIMGWGEEGIVKIPVNAQKQVAIQALAPTYEAARARGLQVIAVVANACSTSTGSYDDIAALADFCEERDLWLHVDGAHGGAVIFSDKYRSLVRGIERADSVVLDYHKMLLTTALATALLFKDGNQAYHTFAQKADYLWESSEEAEWYNLGKRTIECTKHAMSLRIYAIMRTYGREIFAEQVDYQYDLARSFAQLLEKSPDFELAMPPEANILCFRYCPEGCQAEALNELIARMRKAIIESGKFYIVQTLIEGKVYLRTTLMNPFTHQQDLEHLLHFIRSRYMVNA
ncbi:MAG: aminotransferase class I/II-fold pyridoxal phosphate-dependent enzyme [Bacteroidota bacterium]